MTRRIVLAAALAAALAAPAPAGAHTELPDLEADPVTRPVFQVDRGEGQRERLLLRFDSYIRNDGAGAFEIRRDVTAEEPGGIVAQMLKDDADEQLDLRSPLLPGDVVFENTDGHNHFHLQRIARYSLIDEAKTGVVAPAMKVGFCLLDSEQVAGAPAFPGYTDNCRRNQPQAPTVKMGVSSGWRDFYVRSLPFQWVDVSEVQPGPYFIRSEVDPDDRVEESDEVNVPADDAVAVPGYRANALAATGPAVALDAARSGTPVGAAPTFRVVRGPSHGTLSRPTGAAFTDPSLTYAGDGTADRFVYVAADPGSAYPRHPGRATVLLGGAGTERVALSGVPEKLGVGLTVPLRADVFDATGPGVTWSVTGGGTIDAAGRLTAPAAVPPGGRVTVTARAAGGAQDTMDVEIEPAGGPLLPAPTAPVGDDAAPAAATPPGTPPPPPALPRATAPKRVPVGSVRIRRIGPVWSVAIVPRSAGRLRVTLLAGRRRLGSCSVRAAARRPANCRLRVRRGATAVSVTLVKRTGRAEQRHVALP